MLDGLLSECKTPADVDALYTQLLQRVINRSLDAELDAHLGYAKHEKGVTARPNSRNGATKKTIKGKFGELEIRTPREGLSIQVCNCHHGYIWTGTRSSPKRIWNTCSAGFQ
nr:transposase [Tahibacter caeni]